jgi:hypothetical protein
MILQFFYIIHISHKFLHLQKCALPCTFPNETNENDILMKAEVLLDLGRFIN